VAKGTRRRASLAVVSALLAAGLGLSPGCITDAIGATPPGSSPIGVHSMLQLDDPYGFMLAMFAQAAALHASAIRLDVAPALIFTAPGAPADFSGLDEVMALSLQYDLPVVADLTTIPWWVADCQAPTGFSAMDLCGTDDLPVYGAMIGQIVEHADSVIGDWEIWNEPDNGEFFTGTPQQYAQMLGAAHTAIKAVDPEAEVLLGGISGTGGMSWLAQVFSAPDTDAAQDFDIANVHERNRLDALAGDIEAWKSFLAGYGFTGPLWVTEHGYPSDPAYQYDPGFSGGEASQAAYLSASIPTLIAAGAAEVFVTERDNLTGQFASEGLLGGDVSDPPPVDPLAIEKPAYLAVQTLAGCYLALGRDCPGPGPVASPASLTMTAPSPPAAASWTVTVSDPGAAPLLLGAVALTGGAPAELQIQGDSCASAILEPDETCAVSLRFAPGATGAISDALQIPSDDGTLGVPVSAVAPSVSSLASPQLAAPAFTPTGDVAGVADTQLLSLELTNPLSAPIHVAAAALSGADGRRFAITSDRCAGDALAPGSRCSVSVLFTPAAIGSAAAILTLAGSGSPLAIPLLATAVAAPGVTLVDAGGGWPCVALGTADRVTALADQPATISWQIRRQGPPAARGCARAGAISGSGPGAVSGSGPGAVSGSGPGAVSGSGPAQTTTGRSSAAGRAPTGRRQIHAGHRTGFAAQLALPLRTGRRGLRPGSYLLTVVATDINGTGRPETTTLTVTP
jgi:hypothetical protein